MAVTTAAAGPERAANPALVRKALGRYGACRVDVLGDSMLPAIVPPASVKVVAMPFEEVEVGDVVLFCQHRWMLVHRVVAIGNELLTCGDNKSLYDPPLSRDQYIGKVELPAAPGRWWPVTRGGPPSQNPDPGRVHLWILRDASEPVGELDAIAAAWSVTRHLVTRQELSLSGAERVIWDDIPASALTVGVSSAARATAPILRHVLGADQEIHLLVGWNFGGVLAGKPDLLPPERVDTHVRVGPPHRTVDPAVAAAFALGALLGGERPDQDGSELEARST